MSKYTAAVQRAASIRAAAKGRTYTAAQQRDYDEAMSEVRSFATDDLADLPAGLGSTRYMARSQAILATAIAEGRDLTDDELASAVRYIDAADAETVTERRYDRITADPQANRLREGVMSSAVQLTRNESSYRPDGEHSFFRDLMGATRGDWSAAERLHRSNEEGEDRERREGTTGSTSMGSFIPPVWIVDKLAEMARVGRVLAPICQEMGAPTSNSMIDPRITTGSTMTGQAGDNAAVSETDIITAQLTRPTVTIAGQQDVSIQSLELGSAGVDRIVMADLESAYQKELDRQILRGSGTNELLGINQVGGVNAVSYTDTTPTVPELYPKVADAVRLIHENRFAPPSAVVMVPRRWAWICAALDSQTRPLVVPGTGGVNGIAQFSSPNAQGAVGSIIGVPIYVTASGSTTLGAGTEDQIVVFRGDDVLLYESPLRTRILQETLSANLTVRFQAWAYVNAFAGRFPTAISTIGSSGLIAPTF